MSKIITLFFLINFSLSAERLSAQSILNKSKSGTQLLSDQKKTMVFYPKETFETLRNPGRGFATTSGNYNENMGERLHPVSGVIQERWYWDNIEPEEGKIDFEMIDSVIAKALKNGQQLNFRIMTQNQKMRIPEWAYKAGVKAPYYDDEIFLKLQEKLIKALASRYDGNPGLCFMDIGTVGQWGEWHTSVDGIGMPSIENTHRIINFYFDNFKITPLVMLIGWAEGLQYAVSKGAGWRADCWGDMRTGWSHMGTFYPEALKIPGVTEAWKKGNVIMETCWTINKWYEEKWDIDYIFAKALEWHTTEVNNGSESIPLEWWDKTLEFEKKLGYRFVLKKIAYPTKAVSGKLIQVSMEWENKGVAPIYRFYNVALRLTSGDHKYTLFTEADPRKWLPGISHISSKLKLPANLKAGKYEVEIAMVAPENKKPVINLAIEGKTSEGWYPAGHFQIIP